MRVLRRDLDELLADAEAASRTAQPPAGERDRGDEGWRDTREFWGGA